MGLVQLAVLAVVSLILGLFVIRPILSRSPAAAPAQLAPPDRTAARNDDLSSLPALEGEIDGIGDFAPLNDLPTFDSIQAGSGDPAERLRQLIEQKQDETVEVLSQWMNDPQEVTR